MRESTVEVTYTFGVTVLSISYSTMPKRLIILATKYCIMRDAVNTTTCGIVGGRVVVERRGGKRKPPS